MVKQHWINNFESNTRLEYLKKYLFTSDVVNRYCKLKKAVGKKIKRQLSNFKKIFFKQKYLLSMDVKRCADEFTLKISTNTYVKKNIMSLIWKI